MSIWDINKPSVSVEKREIAPRRAGNRRSVRQKGWPATDVADKDKIAPSRPARKIASEVSKMLRNGRFPRSFWEV